MLLIKLKLLIRGSLSLLLIKLKLLIRGSLSLLNKELELLSLSIYYPEA